MIQTELSHKRQLFFGLQVLPEKSAALEIVTGEMKCDLITTKAIGKQ